MKTALLVLLAILVIDAMGFTWWLVGGQIPPDNFYVGTITAHILGVKFEAQPEVTDDGYCFMQFYPKGGFTFSSDRAGQDNYRIIATTKGYELWRKCNQ